MIIFFVACGHLIKRNITSTYIQMIVFLLLLLILYPLFISLFRLATFTEVRLIINTLFKKDKDVLTSTSESNSAIFNRIKKSTSPLWWYLQHPSYYGELWHQLFQKIRNMPFSKNKEKQRESALRWCAERATNTAVVISRITTIKKVEPFEEKFRSQFLKSQQVVTNCPVTMGGPGDLTLLYYLTEHLKATKVV